MENTLKIVNLNELIKKLNEGTIKEMKCEDSYSDKYDDYSDYDCSGPWSH